MDAGRRHDIAVPDAGSDQRAAGGRQEVTFTTDVRTNSIIAAGTKGYLDRVEEIVVKLDSQPIRAWRYQSDPAETRRALTAP